VKSRKRRVWFHWCARPECLFARPFIWREQNFWLIHIGPVEVSNHPIF